MEDSKCPIPKTPQLVSIDRGGMKRPNRMSLSIAGKSNLFNTGDSIGHSGLAATVIVIDSIVPPEIKQNTGEIIYAQNMKPIERDPEQREQYQIILKF